MQNIDTGDKRFHVAGTESCPSITEQRLTPYDYLHLSILHPNVVLYYLYVGVLPS